MSNWIEVNGALIEREFFNENVREANTYEWTEIRPVDLAEHVHCMICGVAIEPKSPPKIRVYKSKGGYVCDYCYNHFLN